MKRLVKLELNLREHLVVQVSTASVGIRPRTNQGNKSTYTKRTFMELLRNLVKRNNILFSIFCFMALYCYVGLIDSRIRSLSEQLDAAKMTIRTGMSE